MNLFKRLLAAGGAAGLLVGLGGATQVFATGPTANLAADCVLVGQSQTISVNAAAAALVHIEVTINGSTVNGGTQHGTGLTDASGTFKDQWTIATVAQVTTASVRVWVVATDGASTGHRDFQIHPVASPCPTASSPTFDVFIIDTTQTGGQVKKTCDAGVSGSAVFAPTLHLNVTYQQALSTTITLPANLTLTLACNGPSKSLPVLPTTSVITLHESTLPTGAAAAADTNITIGTQAVTTTIHNAKAAVVLPQTGQPASTPMLPWPAIVLLGLVALTGAGLVLRRRS